MGSRIIESKGAEVTARRQHMDIYTGETHSISARAAKPRALKTAIRADVGESEGYKEALLRGEIGLQRPMGANVRGVDFITAIREGSSIKEIVVTDVKTSTVGRFPSPKTTVPGTWMSEVQNAIAPGRLSLQIITTAAPARSGAQQLPTAAELTTLEQEIRNAYPSKVRLRQLNANYSAAGQGQIAGW